MATGFREMLARLKGDMTQKGLGELLGLNHSFISLLLRGLRNPGFKTLDALLRQYPDRASEIVEAFLHRDRGGEDV